MKKEEFKKIAEEWKILNKMYDDHIQTFFEDPESNEVMIGKIAELKQMQQELYDLETKWFEVIEGKVLLEE
jgi:hypothetical protein